MKRRGRPVSKKNKTNDDEDDNPKKRKIHQTKTSPNASVNQDHDESVESTKDVIDWKQKYEELLNSRHQIKASATLHKQKSLAKEKGEILWTKLTNMS